MKIAFNPSTVAALTTPPNNKDITFDLRGRNIFARGVKFYGTDTNTWRDIKINNVSIGSHTLDLRNGSNTTLTNTNGVVTINSTWRPVVDNLTSDSTTSSLSAKQGKVLKALIDGKSNSDHNHDGRYLKLTGGTMASNAMITFADSGSWNTDKGPQGARGGLYWTGQSDYAKLYAEETVGDNLDLVIQFGDDNSNGLSIRNKANTQTSYISSSGVITTGTFKGNLDWSYITNKPSSYTPSAHTHAWNSLTHSSTTENQAILTNGKANGWKLYTLNISRWDNAANNAHSHANKSVLDGITSALVNSWNTAYNFVSNITGTDTDKVINKWEEIVNFLAGITEDNKLNTLLNSKLSVYELANNTNVGTIKNNGIYYSTTDASSGTLTNSPFNTGFALINMTSYEEGDDLRRSRLAFNVYGEIKVSDDRDQANTAETWYNVLTSKNSGINGSTIKLNGTSITVYSSGTADGRYVRAFGTSNDNINSDWGQSFKTFDPIPSGTPPEQNPNISVLNIGEQFNRRKQLAFIWNNDNIYYRRHTDSGFTNWRRLAFLDSKVADSDKLDGVHLNGIFTGFSYAQSRLTATIGTVSKTVNVTGSYPSIGGVTMNTIASYGNCMGMANLASSNSNVNPNNQTSWHHFINMSYNTGSTNMWQTQFAIKAGTTEVWVRSRAGGSISDSSAWAAPWVRLARITDNIASATNADMVDGEHASNFSYTHQSSFDFSKRKSGRIVTFDQSNTDYGWINGFASTHNNYLTSVIFNTHRTSYWYVGYMEGNMSTGKTNGLQAVHKLAFADGDESYPIFLGYLHLYNGNDGTISGSFPCLGYSVPFTYTRGGAYCLINIPNTSFQTFYIKAAIASVHYSGAGMGNWVGNHRGDGAWWLHCDAVGSNAVQVKGFHLANENNDSWWGGNPLYSGNGAAKIITVCLFGYVKFR